MLGLECWYLFVALVIVPQSHVLRCGPNTRVMENKRHHIAKLILDAILCVSVKGCWAQYQQSDQTEHENQVAFHPAMIIALSLSYVLNVASPRRTHSGRSSNDDAVIICA